MTGDPAVNDSPSNPNPSSNSGDERMGESGSEKQEQESRNILQSILMSSLDAVEHHTVLAVHVRVLHFVFLPGSPNLKPLPHGHEEGSYTRQDDIAIASW